MIFSKFSSSMLALGALALASCSSTPRAPLPANSSPREALDKVSMELSDATANQYAQLAPKSFAKAVDYRNAAAEKMAKGKDPSKVLDDVASAEHYVQEVKRVGEASKESLGAALAARQYAVNAQAPQFSESEFKSADSDLADLGSRISEGKAVDASDVRNLEKEYAKAEIPARKRAELGSSYQMLKKAKDEGATSKTPILWNQAQTQIATAESAIEVSPHGAEQYSAPVQNAKAATQKLSDVLSIARQKNASEDVALTIYNQNKALDASQQQLSAEQKAAADRLAQEQASAATEQARLQDKLVQRDQKIDEASATVAALDAQNQKYANKAQLEAKIEELKEKFSPSEAEVMKDGKNIVVRLRKMNFATGRSDLNPDSFSTLQKVDNLIAAVPAEQVTVEGHTDSTGSNSKNKELSEKRADAVKKYLLSQGLAENLKVATEGYGSDRPLTTNKTKEGRATNRRVDIVIQTPIVL